MGFGRYLYDRPREGKQGFVAAREGWEKEGRRRRGLGERQLEVRMGFGSAGRGYCYVRRWGTWCDH